ncbi:OsmC family protein [Alkalibacterium sp.]|nr:MAG: OsmC family peroxiredoxin [Alkalibacterium sp.]
MDKMKFVVNAETDGFALTAKAGKHELVLDESEQLGGKNTGPNPMQTALAALVSCENVTANMAAREMDFDLKKMTFTVSGEFDPRGFMGDANVQPYFEEVVVDVKVETSESDERIQLLEEQVAARCPIFTLFKAAGVNLTNNWVKA